MLLSIIVPIYNQEKYLSRCLDSIYNQGLREEDFELLLINDGSTDNSLAIMQSYANHHSNVRIISKDNEGLSATRNRGIKEAVGDYIYMPDSDDYLIANGLSYVIKNFLDDDIDVLMFYSQTVSPEKLHTIPEIVKGEIVYDGVGKDLIKKYINFSATNLIIKSNIVKNGVFTEGIFRPQLTISEDRLFNIELLLNNPRIRIINSTIYRYIVNPQSQMTTRSPQRLSQHIQSYVYLIGVLQNYIDSIIDKDISQSISRVINGLYTPFTNRILASKVKYNELKCIIKRLQDNNIQEPNNRIIKLLFTYPILLIPARWAYKYCFVPFVLPIIKRHNA